ncbi:MAG: aconitate hydratase AcnA [Verrucomicrobia bacterium]|nr:aconitate hydratase AcnA [Verrucomicrobiota bacterium]
MSRLLTQWRSSVNKNDFLKPLSGFDVAYYSLPELEKRGGYDFSRMPFSVKILLESLVRMQGHPAYAPQHVAQLAQWSPKSEQVELPFMPARVLLQDFTGVPCVVDLAALRSTMKKAGQDAARIEPQVPVDLVVDHSVQLDSSGCSASLEINVAREFERNGERYKFLKWGQGAFEKLRVLPPGLGICHQINMEYLASCVATAERQKSKVKSQKSGNLTSDLRPSTFDCEISGIVFPDTLVGTDSHTTTINCMGVLGWGVGGIEAEAAMLGQPIPILTPEVVGFKFTGALKAGVTATDLALTVTRMLRKKGVVGKFVEFYGSGAANLSLADRCPVANMAPEYGATMGFFAIDEKTIGYLRETGRSEEQCALVEAYCKAQGIWGFESEADYNDTLELDLSTVEPALAGPSRPHQQLSLSGLKEEFVKDFGGQESGVRSQGAEGNNHSSPDTRHSTLRNGSVVIASITSCTNTSNPGLMMGAALVAKKAVEKGLTVPTFVKTSLAPGSQAATRYLEKAGLLEPLNTLGFQVAAYGCATCIGNSGPLAPEIEETIKENDLTVAAVLSGNRNFEGRVHPLTKANYLASPALVVAYALAGTVNIDLEKEPIGKDQSGKNVFLKDIWPTSGELNSAIALAADPAFYKAVYGDTNAVSPEWNALETVQSQVFQWDGDSTYIREPTFFEGCEQPPAPLADIKNARVLGSFGDFITTDHISPAGNISKKSPAADYLRAHGVAERDFNSYGSRRGNHEVMMRGTFANIRIKNKMVTEEGGRTIYLPTGEEMFIYDAAMKYGSTDTPLVILAGKMYGAGSSRDWAAKGTKLLGVKAVIAESFERIHRSNLVGMGILPCEFIGDETADSLGLTGKESFTITGVAENFTSGKILTVKAGGKEFQVKARVDAPLEIEYLKNGGVLSYVLRNMMRNG